MRTGAQVQSVDVLGDDAVDAAADLEGGERAMARVGLRAVEPAPAELAARPVALAVLGVVQELA